MSAFKNWDKSILKKNPVHWIWGIHIYLLLFAALSLVFYLIGWLTSVDVMTDISDLRNRSSRTTQLMVLPLIIAGVLFFIRQVKFNSIRVHHSVPYKKPLHHFLVFMATFFFISAVVPVFDLGMYNKAKFALDEEQYVDDIEVLNLGYSHFRMADASKEDYVWRPNRRYEQELKDSTAAADIRAYEDSTRADTFFKGPCEVQRRTIPNVVPLMTRDSSVYLNGYRFDSSINKLIFYRSKLDGSEDYYYDYDEAYATYNGIGGWDTISMKQAVREMDDFIALAPKYGIDILNNDAERIFHEHLAHSAEQYSLQLGDNEVVFDVFADYKRCATVKLLFQAVIHKNNPFKSSTMDFWKWFILVSLFPAAFLFIVVSTTIRDLGWAFLAGSLTFILFSLLVTSFDIDDEWGVLALLFFFIGACLFVMFGPFKRPKLKKAYGMVLHFFSPIILFSFFFLFDEIHSCPYFDSDIYYCLCDDYEFFDHAVYSNVAYFISIGFGIFSIWLFNRFYTRKYVHPKE